MRPISELLNLLELEQIEVNLFRGVSKDIGSPQVFGGQVLAQALNAATRTVDQSWPVHSLHGYFILKGDINKPIIYEVDRIRDGRSFATRRVVAIQHGAAIFNMSASFHREEKGIDHQVEMPEVPAPEELLSTADIAKKYFKDTSFLPEWIVGKNRPIDFRPVELVSPFEAQERPPYRNIWIKANGEMPDENHFHPYVLCYASDFNLISTALLPHGIPMFDPRLRMASLDHAMWFHRPMRADEWMLYSIDSPNAFAARGFARGNVFSQDGKLIASVVQEGLIRVKE